MITTQKELRAEFWRKHPNTRKLCAPHRGKTQNDYPTDVRVAWCDFVEDHARSGDISEALAQRATL